jgi:hypothetical protein
MNQPGQCSRIPAILVLILSVGTIVLYLRSGVDVEGARENSAQSLESMELRIAAGESSPELWFAYGQRLASEARHAAAAAAYAQVLASEPYHREARFGRSMALAQAGESDPFFAYMRDLVYSEPRLAVEVFDRPEVQRYRADGRFRPLHREAHIQALD